ncbi:hypothetical protein F2Q70_00013926 [Brassica cretica]|uniref:WLM domain-containing protein n=1 Tax=Brassica cretica TaxID=69181 RepID=A0A8S9M6V4_BRACR|nr:hypothetical protein F2Q70_00013926 [Brassica cretica]
MFLGFLNNVVDFSPTSPRLLGVNVNRGVQVKLRLRRVNHDADFLSYHEILDTMLHELCHNAHGFYKLWDELRKECEELMSSGITGIALCQILPQSRLLQWLLKGVFLDDVWCGSQSAEALEDKENDSDACTEPVVSVRETCTSLNARSAKRSSSFLNATNSSSWGSDVVDLTEEEASESSRCSKRSCNPAGDQGPLSSETSSSTGYNANQGREETAMWECAECTLLNPLLAPICELCTSAKPKEREMKHKLWFCKFCTLENEVKLEKCEACGQWRYSYGQPLATLAPNVGT